MKRETIPHEWVNRLPSKRLQLLCRCLICWRIMCRQPDFEWIIQVEGNPKC